MTISKESKSHWLSQDLWTLAEAASLLAGKEPTDLAPSIKRLNKDVYSKGLEDRLRALVEAHSPHIDFEKARSDALDSIDRAVSAGHLKSVHEKWLRPKDVIRWALKTGQWSDFPYTAEDAATPLGNRTIPPAERTRERDGLTPLIREALQKASNRSSNAEVLAILRSWTEPPRRRHPLVDVTDGEIKWLNESGEAQFLTKKALGERLKRLRTKQKNTAR
jgi:hypothetical protein